MKKTYKILVTALFSLIFASGIAGVVRAGNTVGATVTVTGALTASTQNSSAAFGSVVSQSTPQTVNTNAGYAEINDTRETTPGWTLSASATNFTSGGNTISSSALQDILGTPSGIVGSNFTAGDAAAGSSPLTFTTAGQNYSLMTAANAKGHGGWRITNDLSLTIPAWQQATATPYSATITITAS